MNSFLKDKLEVILITYGRSNSLKRTLESIFDVNSPIKDIKITVLDNNSPDNTGEVVQGYLDKFPNLKYVKNKYNVGGNANIVKAFEMASMDYIWVLADNDSFCWNSWNEVEQGIKDNADAIVVSKYEYPQENIAQLFVQTTFLPGVIYKVENIDDTVMGNMQFNISNMFPHLALSSKLINENRHISIVSEEIVIPGDNRDEKTGEYKYVRGYKYSTLHPLMKDMNWLAGYANSLYMIKDKKLRNYIATHNMFYYCPLNSANVFYYNEREADGSLYNLLSIFCVLNNWSKIRFVINLILYYTLYRIIYVYSDFRREKAGIYYVKQYKMRLFYFIRMKLFNVKIRGNIA